MQKLEHAIAGQQSVVNDAQRRAEQARAAWLACEQKKMSFVTLAERASKEGARRELWRDQKQNDEHAARRTLHKPNHS
jgi:flagellar FliJ protein